MNLVTPRTPSGPPSNPTLRPRLLRAFGVLSILALGLGLFAPSAAAQEQLISYWDFNAPADGDDSWPSPIAATSGPGQITHNFAPGTTVDFTGVALNAREGSPAGRDFAVQVGADGVNSGRAFVVQTASVGLEDLALSYAAQRSNTGFSQKEIAYSVDGGATWTPVATIGAEAGVWDTTRRLFEFGLPAAAADRADLRVRFTLTGGTAATGNNRFDNIALDGTAIAGEEPPPVGPAIVINEIYPRTSVNTSNDHVAVGTPNEFVELVNTSGEAVDLSGWELRIRPDGSVLYHVFPQGSLLEAGRAMVVFGGGTPQGYFGGARVQRRHLELEPGEGLVGFNARGGCAWLFDAEGEALADHCYGSEAREGEPGAPAADQSITRIPDVAGAFQLHPTATDGRRLSPGFQANGEATFGGQNPDAITVVLRKDRTFVRQPGWRMMGPATAGQTVGDMAAQHLVQGVPGSFEGHDPNFYTEYDPGQNFDPANRRANWSIPAGIGEELPLGRGFIWFFFDLAIENAETGGYHSRALPTSVQFDGPAATTDVTVALHQNDDGHGIWNLLANPFDVAFNVDEIIEEDQIGGQLASIVGHIWDPNQGANGSYVLTPNVVDGDAANVLAIAQGAFFESDPENAPEAINFSEFGRQGQGYRFLGRPESDVAAARMLGFTLAGTNAAGRQVVDLAAQLYFREGAAEGWDRWDARKLTPLSGSYVALSFAGERNGEEIRKAQESRSLNPASFSLPLAVKTAGVSGAVTLTWDRQANLPDAWALTLTDNVTGETVDLREQEAYTFTVQEVAARSDRADSPMFIPRAEALSADIPARFTLNVSTSAVSVDDGAAAGTLALEPAYPNPFASRSTVAFTLPQASEVSVAVYDVLGREVARLVEGERPAGRHEVSLDGSSLASGVYVVRLSANGETRTQRVTLTR